MHKTVSILPSPSLVFSWGNPIVPHDPSLHCSHVPPPTQIGQNFSFAPSQWKEQTGGLE